MKRALAAAVFLVAALNCAHAQPVVTLRPSAVLNELKLFSSMYPRTEGSAGERAAIGNITSSLDRLGVRYTQQSFEDIEGTHSYSSSIDVSIRGKKPDELLFIVPIDQPLNASKANDGSINLALALGMIESLSRTVPPISLRFLFLGGEFGAGPAYPIGTKQFLDNFYPDFPVIALYLDFRSVPNRTNITSGGIRIVAPYWLINRCSSAMDQAGLYYLVRGNENQIFRLGLVSSPPAINPYLQQGYPALELSGIEGSLPADRYTDWVSSFEQFFNNFLEANSSGFPTAWDKHYLFFQIRSFSFIVPERAYVLIVIVLLGLVLAYPIIYRERFLRYLTTIGRNVLSIPLLLAVAFVFLLLGTLLVEGIFVVRNFPTMWRQAPFLFFSCKVAAALFLFALLYRFLKVLPFSRNGRFYGAAAILLLLMDSIVLGLFDFSLAYYFVWALMWSVLFSMVRSRALKIVILAISTAWLLKAIVDVFTLPALDVIRIMILSRISGNAIIAIVILPFLFMIIRVDMMFRHPRRKQ
ncbi:MAG TPA: hypothetical protein VMV68_07745, partial [Spirochaetia bacterium]|nr:hypothetical protein [Spirochaetia bacterium]